MLFKIFVSHITDLSALYIKRSLKLIKEERPIAPMKKWTKDMKKPFTVKEGTPGSKAYINAYVN